MDSQRCEVFCFKCRKRKFLKNGKIGIQFTCVRCGEHIELYRETNGVLKTRQVMAASV
jgi:hypothetical protein